MISGTPQTTTISLAWTQPPGDVVDSYTISYNSTHDQCMMGIIESISYSTSHIDGSMRSYTLTNLEEDSSYTIDVQAINKAGNDSSIINIRTLGAGM